MLINQPLIKGEWLAVADLYIKVSLTVYPK